MNSSKPTVMCFSGLDPTGGAGIQADIETLFSSGCHCAPIITASTVQNTQNVSASIPADPTLVIQQARAVLEDMPIKGFKIGFVGSVECIQVIHTILNDYPDIPVVLDPVIAAGGGYELSNNDIIEAILTLLVPMTTVLTPNIEEIRRLAPTADTVEACANEVLDSGCRHILLSGAQAGTPEVVNHLFSTHLAPRLYTWPRLEHVYHGSGCTLAAALAGFLSHEVSLPDAIQQAQRFTWEALSYATRMGMGQPIPNRSFWSKQNF